MSRVILVILVGIGIYFWFRSRRSADKVIASMTAREVAPGAVPEPSERSAELGLLPAEKQNTRYAAAPAPEVEQALTAARGGDWEPAAHLLSGTADKGDWERRALYVDVLGAEANDDGGAWLAAWEAVRIGDGDAALVRARATEPGEARRSALTTAKDHRPKDPTPYVVEIEGAVESALSHEEMAQLWQDVTARAPHLYAAHAAALQYWLAKGRGSDVLAERFARDAASDAPLGSLMAAFPLIEWFEAHLDSTRDPEEYRTAELTARVDRALMDAAAASPDHPRLPELRHLLAYFLYKQDRYESALEQFRLVDGYINAVPWSRYAEQDLYMRARETTVLRAG